MNSFYPVLQVDQPTAAAQAFVDHFGFEETFAADWYVSLRNGRHEVAFLDSGHETIPDGFRQGCRGVLLNIEVDDARAEYDRLRDARLPVRLPLRDEAFGQRHFIVEVPGGILVDVIEEIPPSASFAAAFVGD
ncbi:VOC family protein [Microbacterium sp. VKM Ac-2923]|uniref:VOC family protein n=1 Tax=Microbacterium sp. VKM Ac-2923 TaxID=2929476 RepID=UPI001FB3F425|nr:VOC family protein [Microbacterium sp. VKM Ac-2923]MCJ1707308.1 glyoxalase [Microbacterium sp. VKM Ac-2923]